MTNEEPKTQIDRLTRERDEARAKLDAEYLRQADAFRLAREQTEHWQRRSGSAFERGAKAMREACARWFREHDESFELTVDACHDVIEDMPIPEEP